jgi:shikimate dehydrogenase
VSRRRFILVGHPVAHSLSPTIHRAAYEALAIEAEYELVDCPDRGALERAVSLLARGEVAGINVTVPWKQAALTLADDAEPLAGETGAANVLATRGGRLVAHNTDVLALVDELERLAPAAERALVLGAGGAALAAVAACRRRGVRRIGVAARRFGPVRPRDQWPNAERFAALGADLLTWPEGNPAKAGELSELASQSDLVIQATSAGMLGADEGETVAEIVPWDRVPPSALAYDVVYTPAVTPFLARARQHGLVAENGLRMLVGQAAHALVVWLGVEAPRDAMLRAAAARLAEGESR